MIPITVKKTEKILIVLFLYIYIYMYNVSALDFSWTLISRLLLNLLDFSQFLYWGCNPKQLEFGPHSVPKFWSNDLSWARSKWPVHTNSLFA